MIDKTEGQVPAPSEHIKEPYTLAEIKAKIASNDYGAELLLQHAMALLDSASLAASAGEPQDLRPALATTFRGLSDRAYCDYIEQMGRAVCLGWEYKTKHGKFSEAELKGHTKAGELFGRHKAFAEAANALEGSAAPLAAPPTAQAKGWRPIETAPKDGRTLLLGYFNSAGKWRTTRGEWLSQDRIDEYAEDPDCMSLGWHETTVEDDDGKCWPIDPTHWMPVPLPPTSAEGVEHG